MTLLLNLFGQREQRNHFTRKNKTSKRRLFFETLEDRRLLAGLPTGSESVIPLFAGSAVEPVEGDTFIVTKDQPHTVFGVTYAIGEAETASLRLTVKKYCNVLIENNEGTVSLDEVATEIEYYTTVTTLVDVVDPADGFVSLREAINYATTNIEWESRYKSAFSEFEDYGYDFTTGEIVHKDYMVADTLYYTPTGYNGSAESIEAAIVMFDASLDDGVNDPKIMLTDELKCTQAFAVDGTVGTKNVILDRGLYTYDDEFLNDPENFKTLITDEEAIKDDIWKRVDGKNGQYGRILYVNAAVPVALSNMTLQGAAGKTDIYGAAIYVKDADLSMTNVSIKGNYQENGDDFGIVWCQAGSIHMVGGRFEGNYVNGWGMLYAKNTDTLYFKDVLVTHNRATQGSFIESQYSTNTIKIVDCDIIENWGNPIHVDSGDVDFIISDTSFIRNYKSGSIYVINGDSTFTNCIFDNSAIALTGIDYHLPVMRPYVLKEMTNTQTYTNCLFNGMGFFIGSSYSTGGHMDITLDHCTVTGCVNPMPPILTSNGITTTNDNYTLDLTLKDSIVIGNDYDLVNNQEAEDRVNITTENSIIGYFKDEPGTAEYETTDSILEEKQKGSMTFVQTDDPTAAGYYEAATATVYMYDWDRKLDLRSGLVSDSSEKYSILGYNSFVYDPENPDRKLETTMNSLVFAVDEYYTTVTTAKDVVADDGVISLREAVAYAKEMLPDGATIQFSETLKDPETGVLPVIILKSDLTINSQITMNGRVGGDRISISYYSTPEIKMINNAYLNLSDVNLDGISLYANESLKPGATCVSGTGLSYFSGINAAGEAANGWLTVMSGSTLTITVFADGEPEPKGTYVIHHADSSLPLHIKYNKGEVQGYQIGNDEPEGTVPYTTDLLVLTKATPDTPSKYFYSGDTSGAKVADILFFGNGLLPVQSEQATFSVTRDEGDVSSSFVWVYTPNTDDKEAKGIKVKDDVTLPAGTYAVSLHYVNLDETFNFTVTNNAAVELVNTEGNATPQNVANEVIVLTSGEAVNFLDDGFTWNPLSWNEEVGNASDYFDFTVDPSDAKKFTLTYKGGLTARVNPYIVTIGASDGITTKTATYSLTVTAPTVTLTGVSDRFASATHEESLANVVLSDNFVHPDDISYTFKLNGNANEDNFRVVDDILIYRATATTALGQGEYTVTVVANDGIDSAQRDYSFTVVPPTFDVEPFYETISTCDVEIDLAELTLNFPDDGIVYELSWNVNMPIHDYLEVRVVPDYGTYLFLKDDLPAGNYTITVNASRSGETRPEVNLSDTFDLTVVEPKITLQPEGGAITLATKHALLADISVENFIYAGSLEHISWVVQLEKIEDSRFSVVFNEEKNAFELYYDRGEPLGVGNWTVTVSAQDEINKAQADYKLVMKDYYLDLVPIFSSLTTSNHDIDVARFVPTNFPPGEVVYAPIQWGRADLPIANYFELRTTSNQEALLHYKSGLPVGEYVVSVGATCISTDPNIDNIETTASYSFLVTESAPVSLTVDPKAYELALASATVGTELASVSHSGFSESPTITIEAHTTTGEKIDFSNSFEYHLGKLRIKDGSNPLVSGEYALILTATTKSNSGQIVQEASDNFVLTLFDKTISTDYTNITIDFDLEQEIFEVTDTESGDPIDEGQANVLVVQIEDNGTTPQITITPNALVGLDAIHISSETENIIIVENDEEPTTLIGNHFTISDSDSQAGTNAVSLEVLHDDGESSTLIARTTSNNTRNITIASTPDVPTQYDINALSTNLLITTNEDDTLNFADGASENGIVLNLDDTDYFQSVYTGQQGSLKLVNSVSDVILSSGNDIITGSENGITITDQSNSWNTITLKGTQNAENVVNLSSGSTIMVHGDATTINRITIVNGANTSVDLSNSPGFSFTAVAGDFVAVTGGQGKNNIEITGDHGIVNCPNTIYDIRVSITGNNAIVKTGSGNDTIVINGNESLVSTGDGDDTIYIHGDSKSNSVSTGKGDDIVISTSTGGNTIHSNGGNDFIIGGNGRDRIFGGTGYSLLAGGRDSDRIIGGSLRDIIIANRTSNMPNMPTNAELNDFSESELEAFTKEYIDKLLKIRKSLFVDNPWWELESTEYLEEVLGNKSEADGVIDLLSRESESGIDIFFRNLSEGDTLSNTLITDIVYD